MTERPFTGVKKGDDWTWEPGEKERMANHIKWLKNGRWEWVCRRPERRRTTDQNAWLWGVAIPAVMQGMCYEPQECRSKEMQQRVHYGLVEHCFGSLKHAKSGINIPNARSSQMTTVQFSEYMEWLVRFAATELEEPQYIPLPDENDT